MSKKSWMQKYDAYVACSTLNQIVNYIPLLHLVNNEKSLPQRFINAKQVYSYDNNHFSNKEWDKNLSEKLRELYNQDKTEEGTKSILNEYELILVDGEVKFGEKSGELKLLDELDDNIINSTECKTILWNITGGQRITVLEIFEIIRKRHESNVGITDVVIYLEGNEGKIYQKIIEKQEDLHKKQFCPMYDYGLDDIPLSTVVELAGLEMYKKLSENNLLINSENVDNRMNNILNRYSDSVDLRLELIRTNLRNENNGVKSFNRVHELISENCSINIAESEEIFKAIESHRGNNNYFGYVLEELTKNKLINTIKNEQYFNEKIIGVYHSVKLRLKSINQGKSEEVTDEVNRKESELKTFCELDFVLLTKYGQVIVLECKSGGMSGDTSKAREYSTYVLGGVYGKPVLITPLMKADDKTEKGVFKKLGCLDAHNSAKRTGLEVWYLDDLHNDLAKFLKNPNGVN